MGKDPPIVELALSLAFDPFIGATILDWSDLYRERFESTYPAFQQVSPLPPLQVGPTAPGLLLHSGENQRLWFIGPDTHDLVQVQQDRVAQNWRRIGPYSDPPEYPGYQAIRSRFEGSFGQVAEWLEEHGVSQVPLTIAELAYVNAIPMRVDGTERRISDILSFYRTKERVPIINFNAGWWESLPEELEGSVQVGFHVAPLPDGEPSLRIELTGRCSVQGLVLADALGRVDIMHHSIHAIFDRVLASEIARGSK